MVGSGVILFWRGIWLITDVYLFPSNHLWSGIASIIIGIMILVFTKSLVSQLVGED